VFIFQGEADKQGLMPSYRRKLRFGNHALIAVRDNNLFFTRFLSQESSRKKMTGKPQVLYCAKNNLMASIALSNQ